MNTTELNSVVEGNKVSSSTEKLRVRKISKQDKYKIYNTETKEIYGTYASRMIADKELNVLKNVKKKEQKKGVQFSEDIVVIHIKDGKNIKKQIKEQLKK